MPWKKWSLVLFTLLLLITAVSAGAIGDQVTLTSGKTWVVANKIDSSTVTAHVTNASDGNDIAGTLVTFSLNDPMYGTLNPVVATTDANGLATTTFSVKNESGTALIKAKVSVSGVEATYAQKIDHDTPYRVIWDYKPEMIVNETSTITINLYDYWWNPIDDIKETALGLPPETITLVVSSPSGDAGFLDGGSYKGAINRPVNAGTVATMFKADKLSGTHIIDMLPLGSIPSNQIFILGLSEGVPYSMDVFVSPASNSLPADGASKFSISYFLKDNIGNPAGNRSISIVTSLGENAVIKTDPSGLANYMYGPRDVAANITITATPVDNSTLQNIMTVEFFSTAPTNIILTANPETMPSIDATPGFAANISAKVMDIKGNPVAGQVVTFSLGAVSYAEVYNVTSDPSLPVLTATTDVNGYATVPFYPGGFTIDDFDPLYDETATGQAVVSATWSGSTVSGTVQWKNFPYLSVETEVNPSTVAVNGTVDVTIRLKGDGWALQPDPIDVDLIIDRSGSMGPCSYPFSAATCPSTSKMYQAKDAAKIFVDQMNQTRDKIGLVSYSTTYSIGYHPSSSFTAVKNSISMINASGNTATRLALKNAIDEVFNYANPNPRSVQAVILMTDGAYNTAGDPLGRGVGDATVVNRPDGTTAYHYWFPGLGGVAGGASGANAFTEQNLSIYANNRQVRVYSISFGSGITVGSSTWNTLEMLSNSTRAKHYHASSGAELADMYKLIAGELMTTAGANATMVNDFSNVGVNNATYVGSSVFAYVYNESASTRISYPNGTVYGNGGALLALNQTDDWLADNQLSFDIGEIKLGQEWEATFRLQVLKEGNIDVFGNSSALEFTGSVGKISLSIPKTYITATPLLNIGITQPNLTVWDLHVTDPKPITDFMPLAWKINYTGDVTATEKLSYSLDGGLSWHPFDTHYTLKTPGDMADNTNLDVRNLPGGSYYIRLEATAPGVSKSEQILGPIEVNHNDRAYIKLE